MTNQLTEDKRRLASMVWETAPKDAFDAALREAIVSTAIDITHELGDPEQFDKLVADDLREWLRRSERRAGRSLSDHERPPSASLGARMRADALALRKILADVLGPLPTDTPHYHADVRRRLEDLVSERDRYRTRFENLDNGRKWLADVLGKPHTTRLGTLVALAKSLRDGYVGCRVEYDDLKAKHDGEHCTAIVVLPTADQADEP